MPISVVLDPTEVAGGRVQLDISQWIGPEIDWGDAAIEAYMAEASMGGIPVDYRVPNRTVVIPLILRVMGGTSFSTIRTQIQQKVARMQAEGGWLKRTTGQGDVFADVVNAHLKLGGSGFWEDVRGADISAELTLECLPDWYGAEIDLGSTSETTLPVHRRVLTGIKGNYPARTRIVVTDASGAAQGGVIWGYRSENYSAAATAALFYEAEGRTPLGGAATNAFGAGASGASNNTLRLTSVPQQWVPMMSTQTVSAGAHMTHVGTYRVWARMRPTGTGPIRARFLWDVGDFINPTVNDPVELGSQTTWKVVDLGLVRLDPSPVGTHRWVGVVQVESTTSTLGGVYIDWIMFQPIDDAAGRIGSAASSTLGLNSYSLYDNFAQTAGNLAGKVAPIGGTWVESGVATNWSVATTMGVAERITSGVETGMGRIAHLPVSLTDQHYTAYFYWDNANPQSLGAALRYQNDAGFNGFYVMFSPAAAGGGVTRFDVVERVAGANSYLMASGMPTANTPGVFYKLDVDLTVGGDIIVWVNDVIVFTGQRTALATAGALASGFSGFFQYGNGAGVVGGVVNDLTVFTGNRDAAVFASQSMEIRWDGVVREDSTGTAYGPSEPIIGDLPRIPTAGLEARSVEQLVKVSRGNIADTADSGIDDVTVQTIYRPCWLFVPEA